MSYKLTINDNTFSILKYHKVEETIREALAYWNNFGDKLPLNLKIEKVEDENAVQVKVQDGFKVAEGLG